MAAWRAIFRVRYRNIEIISFNQRRSLFQSQNSKTVTVARPILIPEKNAISKQIVNWLRQYEDFVGLSEVREAQNRVIAAQNKFMDTQEARRDRQRQIQEVQHQLKNIHAELDKTSRGEDRYLHLITQEHAIIKQEKQFLDEFQSYEKAEREYFTDLSNAVRTSHEKERAQAEKTKYWSIIGSVCGAIIGILGTTINNWLRMRELRGLVTESTSSNGSLHDLLSELSDATKNQHNLITLFLADLKSLLSNENSEGFKATLLSNVPNDQIEIQTNEILDAVKRQESTISNEMKEIKSLILAKKIPEPPEGTAIYIGRDVEQLMKEAEQNLEYKIKLNALGTVAMIYGILALTVPILFKAFGGG